MNWLIRLGAVAVLCAAAGTAAANPPAGLTKPTDDELRAAMEGRAILPIAGSRTTAMGGGMASTLTTFGDAETYCPGGVFVIDGPRDQRQTGTWTVEDGKLCNQTPSRRKQCVFVFMHAEAGIIFARDKNAKGAYRPYGHPAVAGICDGTAP